MLRNRRHINTYPCEDEIDQSEAERCDESILLASTGLSEHSGTVKCFGRIKSEAAKMDKFRDLPRLTDDVDTALSGVSILPGIPDREEMHLPSAERS